MHALPTLPRTMGTLFSQQLDAGDQIVGSSCAYQRMLLQLERIAASEAPALVEGETGSGKEVAARAIHYGGRRRAGPFVPVNCGALPDSLIESELFGVERGAFTDARRTRRGLVAEAAGGTLFLDEVDALSPKAQVTLLRFLQDQQFRPLGGRREEQADVRIITAANRVLERLVEGGAFRLDLLYRLKLLHLTLPPLREREADIALLAEHFVRACSARYGKPALPIDPETLAWFRRHRWPGNIRELENLIQRHLLLADGERICIAAPPGLAAAASGADASASYLPINYRQAKKRAVAEFESRFLENLMGQANGNVSAAARISGTERRHLGRLLKKHGIAKDSSSNP